MADGNDIYWLSFRIAEVNTTKGDYGKRYQALVDTVHGMTVGTWWVETSSFFMFRCSKKVEEIIAAVKAAIAP